MLFVPSLSYKHSGKFGDIIFSLAFVKATGGGCFYTNYGYKSIKPLLKSQKYIIEVQPWKGQKVNYNLDKFRTEPTQNLCCRHFKAFRIAPTCNKKWLDVKPNKVSEIVISRSFRYHHRAFPWRDILAKHTKQIVFVGSPKEHQQLLNLTKIKIEYYPTKNLLELASVVAGSRVFIGNQSCPNAIAEGLKHTLIQETSPYIAVSLFKRKNFYCFTRNKDSLFNFLNKALGQIGQLLQ
jgi:hypothetical protein